MDKMYLEFTLDYDGECEDIDTFEVGSENKIDEIHFEDVNKFVKELKKLDGFKVSDHRTWVRVWWFDNGTMSVHFRYFNEPEDGEFDDYELEDLEPIEVEYTED